MNRNKITRLAFGIVVVSFLLSACVSFWSLYVLSSRNMEELNRSLAARIYDTIAGELAEPAVVAETMAHDSFLIGLLSGEEALSEAEAGEALREYLTGIRDGLNYEAAFVISDATLRYYTPQGVGKRLDPVNSAYDRWYTAFLDSGRAYEFDVDNNEFSREAWTVFVNARIEDAEGRLLGVCGVGDRMLKSQASFLAMEREYGVKIDLVSPDGLIQVDTDESRIENVYLSDVLLSESGEYHVQRFGSGRYVVSKYIDKLGWYLVVQSDGSAARGELLHVILLNIGVSLLIMVILIFAVRIIAMRTIALANASFRDQATQLYNRRAFEEDKAEMGLAPPPEDLVYMTADVNGLKTANDTLGHAAGDELIRGAADCLRLSFEGCGRLYRIGGDEFAAILRLRPEELEERRARLEESVAAWRGEKVGKLSVSCGYASAREFPSENLAELSRISDERMYAAKEEHYRRTGAKRR